MTADTAVLHGLYSKPLVALSVLIAILAACAAIDLAGRVTSARGAVRQAWLIGGAFAMGSGIWSMHYIGMLAFQLPIPVRYDWPIVLLSLFAAMAASWVSLYVVSRDALHWYSLAVGSIVMGSGIAAMHYIGMAAMRLEAMHHYSFGLVTLSVVLAIVIASVALMLTFWLRGSLPWGWRKFAAAVTMGAAIPVMHYVGMAAVTFVPMPAMHGSLNHAVAISDLGLLSIVVVTVVILSLVFLTATVDRRFAVQATALQSSEQRYRLIIEGASDAFLQMEPNGRIVGWNAHAERLFGWTREQALNMSMNDLLRLGAAEARVRKLFDPTAADVNQERVEVTGIARDGREFPAEMTLSAIHFGEQTLIAAFLHDVTDRKIVESERERAKIAAEAGSRAKSEFLANMSHEIRTPLNGVIGMSELLLDTQLNETQRDYADTIRDSSLALMTIINDILDFSKVEAGKLDLEKIDMSLRDTIEDVARLLSIQAHDKGLEITLDIDPRLPELVSGDAGRLRQILLNLGGNAIKFTAQGEVSIAVQSLDSDAQGTLVRCEVSDTGIGIPPDRVKTLFTPFTQADTSTTRKFGGTGLGLSIVRRLVELMGGETGVDSTEGQGSKFWFTARFARAAAGAQLLSAPGEVTGKRILIVDDNATNRKVLWGQVRQCGAIPDAVGSADDALAAMRRARAAGAPFDAALIDQQMPECDGARLGSLIGVDPRLRATRMILLTSSGQRGDGARFAEIGFAGYLLKPVTQRELSQTLTLVLGSPAESWHMRSQPIITQQALETQRIQSRQRILLAEDNLVNQKVAVKLLEKLGYRVDVVGDGKAAIAALQDNSYDLVLMDCQMPELDGYEATRRIRETEVQNGNAKHIPIIALTADALKGTEAECRAAGMDGYLTKPIDRDLLASTLGQALAKN